MKVDEVARELRILGDQTHGREGGARVFETEAVALLTDWDRETRLDEAKWWEHLVTTDDEGPCGPDCVYCQRIAELSRPAEKGKA